MAESTRKERRLIMEGNKLYKEHRYGEAAKKYEEALKENSSSAEALFNVGLTQVRRAESVSTDSLKKQMLDNASKSFSSVASLGGSKAKLASRAAYNLGNIAFNSQNYKEAITSYKQALRLNPDDDSARRNLRIAQKKLEDQNKDKNQNQDKQNQQDKQDKKDKQDQQQPQNNQDKQDQKQKPEEKINQQNADQILQSLENKENALRARMKGKGDKSSGAQRGSVKNW